MQSVVRSAARRAAAAAQGYRRRSAATSSGGGKASSSEMRKIDYGSIWHVIAGNIGLGVTLFGLKGLHDMRMEEREEKWNRELEERLEAARKEWIQQTQGQRKAMCLLCRCPCHLDYME
uniref:Uncharacterized protein n=1 Tax=Oryza meridionalis TaxID=40149 RepID=A0A0E0E4M9_9ORYZ